MADVIGTADPDARQRPRRRIPRWVTWAAVAIAITVGIVVPAARDKFAARAAAWLRDQWRLSTSYDDARFASIAKVASRAGPLDDAIVEQAARATDREEAAALQRIAESIGRHRMWSSSGDRTRDAAVAAVVSEIATLREDAQARHPSTTYLFAPAPDRLASRAAARIDALARHYHLGAPRPVRSVTLPSDQAALARLRLLVDFHTGLSLVLSGPGQPQILDLDTGGLTPLRLPDGETDMQSWAGRILVTSRSGVQAFDVRGRPGIRYTRRYADVLSKTGKTLWLYDHRRVRRYAANGRPLTPWIQPPANRTPVAATGAFIVLGHIVDDVSLVGELWNPATGALQRLPLSCFGGWLAAAETIVAVPCGGDRRFVTVDTRTESIRQIRLPRPADDTDVEPFSPLSPTGRQFAVALTGQGVQPGLVDLRSGQFRRVPGDGTLTVAAWSTDGQWVLLADPGTFGLGRRPQVALWRPKNGRMTSIRLSAGMSPLNGMPLLPSAAG